MFQLINTSDLGPLYIPAALRSWSNSGEITFLAAYLLVKAYQHIWLLKVDDTCKSSHMLTISLISSPSPPYAGSFAFSSQSLLRISRGSLSLKLHTIVLPQSHVQVENFRRNGRSCQGFLLARQFINWLYMSHLHQVHYRWLKTK